MSCRLFRFMRRTQREPIAFTSRISGLFCGAAYRRRLRMDRVALFVTPPAVAETVTEVLDEPGDVVTVKVAELLPGATVTLAGTLATEGLLLDSATSVPPAGAGPLRVTVPLEELP